MSVIQRIRDRAAWIVTGAIGISLLAFILQDYFFNKGRGSMFGSGSTIGKINGYSIDHDGFEKQVSFYEQMSNGQSQRSQLVGQVWEYLVNQTIINQETDRLGITISSNEMGDVLFGKNPPQWMQQNFTDPKTGVFNATMARQQFASIKKNADDPKYATLNQLLDQTELQTKAEKYQSLISGAVYIPKWMSAKLNADNNSVAKASYVYVPYTTISDSTVKVSDDELEAYIKKHASQYKRDEATRTVSYVSFSGAPNANDSTEVRNNLSQLKQEFASSTDEKTFLTSKGNEAQYYNSFIGGKEIKQAIKDTLFKLAPGTVYGPYLDGSNYAIAKLVAEQSIPDSSKVRHILVATHQQDPQTGQLVPVRDDSAAMKRLDSAIALIKGGASWDSVVSKYSDDPGSKDKGGVYNNFPSGQMDEAFNDFSFTGKVGETKTVHTVFGYHYVEILGQTGSQQGYKIAYLTKPISASAETDNAMSNTASQFAAVSRNQKDFEANAKKQNLTMLSSQEIKQNDFTVQGLGESREMVRWIFDNKVGDISEPFDVSDNYVVAMITSVSPEGLASPGAVRQSVEMLVRNEKKAQAIIAKQMKGSTLDEVSKNAKQPLQHADSVSFSAFVVNGLGNEPQFIGAAFNKQLLNKVSSPVAGRTGVFVVRSEGISGAATMGETPEMQKQQMEQMLKQQASQSVTALRKAADVKDYRSKFY